MAKILLTWELGGGLGHLLPLRALGRQLLERGHQVTLAVRRVDEASTLFAGTAIAIVQAPFHSMARKRLFPKIGGYAHLLANAGFGEVSCLTGYFDRWNALFDECQPNLVIADHSPLALLALRGRAVAVATVGLGFCAPPDAFPLPFWTPAGHLPARLKMADDERAILMNANAILRSKGRPMLERMGQLFNQVDEVMLATYQELDPFNPRKESVRYWGHWHDDSGGEPRWPESSGPKVFAYLKPFPGIDMLLKALKKASVRCLVVAGDDVEVLSERHAALTLRFERGPVNMSSACHQCDVGITNAGHGTTASLLLAGKPMLLFPLFVEQLLNAQSVAKLGAAKVLTAGATKAVDRALGEILSNNDYRDAAQAFAQRYTEFASGHQLEEIVSRLDSRARQRRMGNA